MLDNLHRGWPHHTGILSGAADALAWCEAAGYVAAGVLTEAGRVALERERGF